MGKMNNWIGRKIALLVALCLLTLTSCTESAVSAVDASSLCRAIDSGNLEWVKESIEDMDLDRVQCSENAQHTNSALVIAMNTKQNREWEGPTDIFRFLLSVGAGVNSELPSGDTPCFRAVGFSDEAGIRYMELMLKYGADLSIEDKSGYTVLDEAVRNGANRTAFYLIANGACPSAKTLDSFFHRYSHAKDWRCDYTMLKLLVADCGLASNKIPIAIQRVIQGEPLTEASRAELSEEDFRWQLCCVAAFGVPETIVGSDMWNEFDHTLDAEGLDVWAIAASTGNQKMLDALLKHTDDDSGERLWQALNQAVAACQKDCVAILLESFQPECINKLDDVEQSLNQLWRHAVSSDDPELLMELYEHGLCPTSNGVYDCIVDAIRAECQSSLIFLLEHFDTNPGLYLDIVGRYANETAARILLEYGVSQEDADYALSFAAAGGSAEIVQLMLEEGANPSNQDAVYGSPLLIAAQRGYMDIVDLLLSYDANPKQVYWGEKDNILIETAFGSTRILQRLIDSGAEVNFQNTEGRTPLHYAVINNRPENVMLLLEKGANPSIEDAQGCSPLDIAIQEGFDEVVSILNG